MTVSRPPSLRRRMMTVGAVVAAVAMTGVALLSALNHRLSLELATRTGSLIEEQRVADAIIGGVLRQLTVTSAVQLGESAFRAGFDEAGTAVHEGLRTYLFRDLDAEERQQLERAKTAHQSLEVGAIRAANLVQAGDLEAGEDARQEVMEHGLEVLDALEGFVRMREAGLQAVAERQEVTFRRLRLAGIGIALALGIILAGFLGRTLHRRVTRPLRELGDAANRIGEGDLQTRVPVHYDRELRALAVTFNRMAERLADAQAEIVQSEKLGAVGRMTAGIAHELNNPLASVLGYSELLAAELRAGRPMDATRAAEYLDPIVREATRARALIRSLLQFSRRAGSEIVSVSLREAMGVVVDLRAYAFHQAGLSLRVADLPEVAVTAERQQLENAFLNIVNNALDAMKGRGTGTLRITAAATDTRVRIVFADDGPGLEHPDRVFEPFYTTKDVGEGTGLGLALALRAVTAFGGTLRASNRPEGGARFDIELPRTDLPPVAVLPAPAAPSDETVPVTGRTVLVVEDEPDLQDLSRRLLRTLGVSVRIAGSVADARAVLADTPVDAVVSDVKMPGESGVEFYRWLQVEHPDLAARFLFVTGDIHAPELEAFAAAHPEALILKPFELGDYLRRVRGVLEGMTAAGG